MKEIEQILNAEAEKYIDANPYKNDKTIKGLSNRLKYMRDSVDELTKKVNFLSNEYLKKNPDTDVKELNDIAKNTIERFLGSALKD